MSDELKAENERLREVVAKCGERFREYEASHREKAYAATREAEEFAILAKADRNREMAELCVEALQEGQSHVG